MSRTAAGALLDLSGFDAGIFDLDGVVTRTAIVHQAAWKELFDDYLRQRADRNGEPFRAFEPQDIGSTSMASRAMTGSRAS